MPLDKRAAYRHGQTYKVYRQETGELFPLMIDTTELGKLGVGVPLYFDFQKKCMSLLLISTLVFLFCQIHLDYDAKKWKGFDWKSLGGLVLDWPAAEYISLGSRAGLNYSTTFSCSTAFANVEQPDGPLDSAPIYSMIALYICLAITALLFAWYPSSQKELAEIVDQRTTSIDDFTIWITGFSDDPTVDEDVLLAFLDGLRPGDGPASVVRIVFAYDLDEVWRSLAASSERTERLNRLVAIEQDMFSIGRGEVSPCCWGWCCPRRIAKNEILKVKREITNIEKESQESKAHLMTMLQSLTSVGAYVTFQREVDAQQAADAIAGGCCGRRAPRLRGAHGVTMGLEVCWADHPSDIFWQNLGHRPTRNLLWRTFTKVVSLALIAGSFIVISKITEYDFEDEQIHIDDRVDKYQRNVWESMCIIVVNFALFTCMDKLAVFERRRSFTKQEVAAVWQHTLNSCLNSGIVIIVAHWMSDATLQPSGEVDWYSWGALVTEALFLLGTNALVSPLFFLIDPYHVLVRVPSRWFIDRWTSRNTQARYNEMHLAPNFSLAGRVGDTIKTLYISFLFAPMIPLTPLLGLINLILQHFVDRFVLLRLARRPHWYDKRILTSVVRYPAYVLATLPFAALLLLRTPKNLTISYFGECVKDAFTVWDGLDHNLVSIGAIIALLLLFLFAAQTLLFAIRFVITCSCCRKARGDSLLRSGSGAPIFEDVQHTFLTHYHKENPVYRMLREPENPVAWSESVAPWIVGTRGGKKIAEFLREETRLDELLTVLAEDVGRQAVFREQGVSSVAPGQKVRVIGSGIGSGVGSGIDRGSRCA